VESLERRLKALEQLLLPPSEARPDRSVTADD
jgi:hypothetical protein